MAVLLNIGEIQSMKIDETYLKRTRGVAKELVEFHLKYENTY